MFALHHTRVVWNHDPFLKGVLIHGQSSTNTETHLIIIIWFHLYNIAKTLYRIQWHHILPLPSGLFCCVFLCNLLVEGENICYTQTGRTPCSMLFYHHCQNHKPCHLTTTPWHLGKLQIQTRRSFLLFLPSLLARTGYEDEKFHLVDIFMNMFLPIVVNSKQYAKIILTTTNTIDSIDKKTYNDCLEKLPWCHLMVPIMLIVVPMEFLSVLSWYAFLTNAMTCSA